MGINAPDHGGDPESGKKNLKTKFYQVHWYMNPLMFWLEVLIDSSCLEQQVFDLAYITEVDPLWADDEATFVLNPDAALFTNIIAQAACMGDCVAATAGMPLNELFWCVGCQGSMYPLTGWVGSVYGGVQASSLLVARFTNKMHREFLIWAGGGSDGLCGYYPQPLMDKQNYKFQMVYPVRQTEKIAGKCCQPFGRSDILWGAGKEFPYTGEDFSYQIFRQRTCCQGKSIQ
jgi:conjugal transfer pilus assembly protein TraU